jgi:hypothetical protein
MSRKSRKYMPPAAPHAQQGGRQRSVVMRANTRTLIGAALLVLLAACATREPPADVAADISRHAQYSFRYLGSSPDKFSLISVEGWVLIEPDGGEFELFESKDAFSRREAVGHCLSGRFADVSATARLIESVGKKVRIVGDYAPTFIDDGTASMSAIHNFCMGDIEIHGLRFEVL